MQNVNIQILKAWINKTKQYSQARERIIGICLMNMWIHDSQFARRFEQQEDDDFGNEASSQPMQRQLSTHIMTVSSAISKHIIKLSLPVCQLTVPVQQLRHTTPNKR
jgi:hypothetical protein